MAAPVTAALTEAERETLSAFVASLAAELGDDLDGVWLYGSRARGENTHPESDIDVLVLTRDGERDRRRVWEAALESGEAGLKIAPITTTRKWVEERRGISSFFLQEVDRDKIVLHGPG